MVLNVWQAEKMNKRAAQQREPSGSYGSGRQISGFPPVADYTEHTQCATGIWHRLTFSTPNYQAPYWLSSGRWEVILFRSPFGKLIHFTKVTW